MITIKCKVKDCPGIIFYEPKDIQLNFVFYTILQADPDLTFPLAIAELNELNQRITGDSNNNFNTIETVWLTCDADPFHSNPYRVPKK